ncbi:transcription factor Tfb2-domain-containing protein [Zopfochytrium polystomum]|nr:transcription factor Tfb2-domain-containing protein [Zopfochytrium polystomum]
MILEYIQQLPRSTFNRLYEQPSTCLALLRLLPALAKHIVMRLLYAEGKVAMSDIQSWCYDDSTGRLKEDLTTLSKFHIVGAENDSSGLFVSINEIYRRNLHNALVGGGQNASFGQPADSKDKHPVDISHLDTYAAEAWEAVLHYLVGTPTDRRPKAVMKLLEHSGLMARIQETGPDGSPELRITNKGFQFLLQDVNVQVWAFLLQYLEMADELSMDPVDVLNFLFQLGSLELGQGYSVDALTETQRHMLDDLKHLGIVYQRKKKSSRFYPTRLATSLTSGTMVTAKASDEAGFIIVETNFKVYAYTSSPLQIAVLSLFVSMRARFANMVIAQITRDSIREALSNGISAEQIIAYLQTHAHPEMKRALPILPETVVDQIRLWELERNRVKALPGYLWKDFGKVAAYKDVLNYAMSLGYVTWYSDERKMFVVSGEGQQRVKDYYAKRKDQQ